MIVECGLFTDRIVVRFLLFPSGCFLLLLRFIEQRGLFHDEGSGVTIEVDARII